MDSSNMKNMVVLKNLPSNLIEEAIVILKNNVNIKLPQLKGEVRQREVKGKDSDYIVKEAEMHIAQYVSGIEKHINVNKTNRDFEKKYKRLKKLSQFFMILAILGMLVNFLKY